MEPGGGGENFVSRFLKIVALIFRVDSESAKKVFWKNPTFLRLVRYLSKWPNFGKIFARTKIEAFNLPILKHFLKMILNPFLTKLLAFKSKLVFF